MQEHFEYSDNQEHLEKEHSREIIDATRHIATRDVSHAQPKTNAYEDRPPFGTSGNNGNNMPPWSPRQNLVAPPSPPRHPPSHHEEEANDDISSEELVRFEQDDVAQRMMLKLLECNGDQYFQYMTSRVYSVPLGYDIHQIVQ